MRSLGLLRQSKASKVIISFSIVCLHIIHSDSMLFIKDNCLFLNCLQIPLYKLCAVSHCAVKQLIEVKTLHGLGIVCLEAFSASGVRRGSGACSVTQLRLFPLCEPSCGLCASAAVRLRLRCCVLSFLVLLLHYILKTFVLFLKLSSKTCENTVFCFYYSS